ncbi:hypothetical protein PHJA_002073500 [Phtheirospermum japonicum]|uniref:Uncharacterized protein n=1 Tax=Phtheirospermum japonicum TaxID=374723 RepID=A0A830CT22_9LAMI|nr:hypothetical protein PHJA_002073500 [Phtheirospermum japonicum]
MEINACLFFLFWAIISLTFLKLGFNALDRTDFSTSVSPVVMSIFKHAFATIVSHSSDHNFIQTKKVILHNDRYHIWTLFLLVTYVSIGGPILIYLHIYNLAYSVDLYYRPFSIQSVAGVYLWSDLSLKLTMMCFGDRTKFIPMLSVLIGCYTSAVWAAMSDEERLTELLPVAARDTVNSSFLRLRIEKRGKLVQLGVQVLGALLLHSENRSTWRRILDERRKLIEFAVGMVGTILFQNFFRVTSFDHVLAFLYLAVSWLGNLALLQASGDFGFFNFLLGNVIVGCTVSQFGLRGTTWIVYGASILLYGLRLKLESMFLADRGESAQVIVF